jgi:RNA polymerase sigma factor (sigma-70 family)
MVKTWYEMTPKEREDWVNQDFVSNKFHIVDPSQLDRVYDGAVYTLASGYNDRHIPEYDVQCMLAVLTKRQRDIIRLIYLEGETQENAAAKLGISRRALRTHVERARDKLKKCSHLFIRTI